LKALRREGKGKSEEKKGMRSWDAGWKEEREMKKERGRDKRSKKSEERRKIEGIK
jgi:hypothetical protein